MEGVWQPVVDYLYSSNMEFCSDMLLCVVISSTCHWVDPSVYLKYLVRMEALYLNDHLYQTSVGCLNYYTVGMPFQIFFELELNCQTEQV